MTTTQRPHTALQFDHASICVGDVDEAVRFYRDILGLEPIERPDFGFPGAWFRAGGTPVHLTTGGAVPGSDARLRPNEGHVALCVTEGIQELVDFLNANGVKTWELMNSPAAERQIFLHDPWGNMIELCTYYRHS